MQTIDVKQRADRSRKENIELIDRPQYLNELPRDQNLIVHCQSGVRSANAMSVLQAAGFTDMINMSGGNMAWQSAGLRRLKQTA